MEHTFHLTIISPHQLVFDSQAISITLPGQAGSACILAYHEPLVMLLAAGKMAFKIPGDINVRIIDVNKNSFFDFCDNKATVILAEQ